MDKYLSSNTIKQSFSRLRLIYRRPQSTPAPLYRLAQHACVHKFKKMPYGGYHIALSLQEKIPTQPCKHKTTNYYTCNKQKQTLLCPNYFTHIQIITLSVIGSASKGKRLKTSCTGKETPLSISTELVIIG